jgi:Uma2 family endonuclease
MVNALPKSSWLLTVDEYLESEEQSDVRHEYVGGEVHAMAGATVRHALIISNVMGYLWSRMRGGDCRTMSNDVKLQVEDEVIYYPDVIVTCDPEDRGPLILKRPTFVAEVLSPSTMPTDRREKMIAYRRLPTVLCYLVIHQDKRLVEYHWRESTDGRWEFAMVEEGEVEIPGLDVRLALDQIYEGVDLDAPS